MLLSDIDPAQEERRGSSGSRSGLKTTLKKAAGGFSFPTSTGLIDRLNDTVEVAACLQLIFQCD